jgi:GntR family transcriptional regulator
MFDAVPSPNDMRPLYDRIASALRGEILSGRIQPGDRLPPIAALAATYSVAPVTVRQALKVLSDAKLVQSRRGSGTYAMAVPPRRAFPAFDVGWPQLTTLIQNHRGRILEASDEMPDLRPDDGEPAPSYRRMLRVHTDDDGEPYAVAEIFVDRRYYDLSPKRFNREMVLSLLEEMAGTDLPEMRQTFTLAVADARIAEHLGLHAGDPVGRLRRVLLHKNGEVVYYAITLSRADRIAYQWVLRRPEVPTSTAKSTPKKSRDRKSPDRKSSPRRTIRRS